MRYWSSKCYRDRKLISSQVIVTVGYHINALTGEVSGERDAVTGLRSGTEVSLGTPATAFLLPFDNCDMKIRVLAVVDPSSVVRLS